MWKDFRGPRDQRTPYHGDWYRQPGLVQSRGFGMFEVVDLCTALGCAPIITLNDRELPQDAADFVEYCWGDGNTTWGALRIADGHPQVYNVSHVEVSVLTAHPVHRAAGFLMPGFKTGVSCRRSDVVVCIASYPLPPSLSLSLSLSLSPAAVVCAVRCRWGTRCRRPFAPSRSASWPSHAPWTHALSSWARRSSASTWAITCGTTSS